MLTREEILFLLDALSAKRAESGYSTDEKASALQAKLSIMLAATARAEKTKR